MSRILVKRHHVTGLAATTSSPAADQAKKRAAPAPMPASAVN